MDGAGCREEEGGVDCGRVGDLGERWQLGVRVLEVHEIGVDRHHGRRLAAICVEAGGRPEEFGPLLHGHPVPVIDGKGPDARWQAIGRVGAGVGDRVGVVVVSVEEHDPGEARGGERGADVLDDRHERRDAQVDDTGEADVRVRQPVVDRWRDQGANPGGDAAGDFHRDEDVRQERPMWPVLLRGSRRDDDGLVLDEECLDLAIGHLAHEHGRRLHLTFLLVRSGDTGGQFADLLDPDRGDVPRLQVAVGPQGSGEPRRGSGRDQVTGPEHDVVAEIGDHLRDRETHL